MDEWFDAFFATSYVDADAVLKPWLKARGEHTEGPFNTYAEAERSARARNCTHYEIRKVVVKNPPMFLTNQE